MSSIKFSYKISIEFELIEIHKETVKYNRQIYA